jgi:hypothetical protein
VSLQYNDTSTLRGIIQIYEKELGFAEGRVSDSTTAMQEVTADINLALDDFVEMAIKSDGTWQWDDSNQTDYPIMTTNLVDGQRDYAFTTDGSGNLVLEVLRVFVANSSGLYGEIYPVDAASDEDTWSFSDGQNSEGQPCRYDKTANGILLDPIPSYNYTNGLKLYVNREASYFTTSDTTKKPGVPGIFHKYFPLRAAQDFARRNSLAVLPRLEAEVARMEANIKGYYGRRARDERHIITTARINHR